jgi:hypothetical protein
MKASSPPTGMEGGGRTRGVRGMDATHNFTQLEAFFLHFLVSRNRESMLILSSIGGKLRCLRTVSFARVGPCSVLLLLLAFLERHRRPSFLASRLNTGTHSK